jgi:hypothetical protein
MTFKTKKPRQIAKLEKQMDRIAEVTRQLTDDLSRTEADRNFREALGNTRLSWIEEMPVSLRQDVLFMIMVAAKPADRRKLATHALCDEALLERVEAEIARRAGVLTEERERKAADAKAQGVEAVKQPADADA